METVSAASVAGSPEGLEGLPESVLEALGELAGVAGILRSARCYRVGAGEKLTPLRRLRSDPLGAVAGRPGWWGAWLGLVDRRPGGGVLDVERWAELRREHFVRGVSINELVRRTGLARNTIRSALRSDDRRHSRALSGRRSSTRSRTRSIGC